MHEERNAERVDGAHRPIMATVAETDTMTRRPSGEGVGDGDLTPVVELNEIALDEHAETVGSMVWPDELLDRGHGSPGEPSQDRLIHSAFGRLQAGESVRRPPIRRSQRAAKILPLRAPIRHCGGRGGGGAGAL